MKKSYCSGQFSYILCQVVKVRRCGSLININPSGLGYGIFLLLHRKVKSIPRGSFQRLERRIKSFARKRSRKKNKTGVINDPLGQTYSLASSEHCFHSCFVPLDFEMWGWTDVQTDMCENNYPYRP